MNYELKNIKVLGYTTDFNQCECCGKDNLKGTVSILDIDSGVILHFGTSCAVSADKYDSLNAYNKAKKEVNSIKRDLEDTKQFARVQCKKNNISDINIIDSIVFKYLKFRENAENRFVPFNNFLATI